MGCECGKEKGCSSCCSNESCCSYKDEMEDKSKMMMDMANEAWHELMKDKIKSAYEKLIGEKMNKTAHVCAEMCIAYWGNKMKEEMTSAEFEDKIRKAMM